MRIFVHVYLYCGIYKSRIFLPNFKLLRRLYNQTVKQSHEKPFLMRFDERLPNNRSLCLTPNKQQLSNSMEKMSPSPWKSQFICSANNFINITNHLNKNNVTLHSILHAHCS